MHIAELKMRRSTGRKIRRVNHKLFRSAQHTFDKYIDSLERQAKKQQSNELEGLQTEDPRTFWQLVNNLGPKRFKNNSNRSL